MTDPTPLAWLRSTVEAADEGPWVVVRHALWGQVIAHFKGCHLTQASEKSADSEVLSPEQAPPNALSIVTLHNLAPELLAVVEAAQELHYRIQWSESDSGMSMEYVRDPNGRSCKCGKLAGDCTEVATLAALDLRVEEERA